ncbi:4-hydroxy-tetrahydrodipicolinate reductase [Naasia sp. SYSU D00057]|uniref:4-hydroxy-tetrahydrodipicolinate reductase n=1 Tax=Naasia sp. SYSU D00057 TaxID=2817380 RepID=UPI0027DD929A|nr:4-hydroxy-tetrahydrodipicolinate reductase [Naasia sp. SYSU D00057]
METAPITRVAIAGATGRMGSLAARLVEATDGFELAARLDSRTGLEAMDDADLLVDFTLPQVSPSIVEHAVAAGLPAVVGTSGWSSERIDGLRRRVGDGPGVLIVPNFSVGSVLATAFAAMAARFFDSIEIVEAHHAGKVDSPSGTAVRTAELIAAARADLGPVAAPHADQRARGQQVGSVPVHSLRLAGVVAQQDVHFGGTGEVLTLTHQTVDSSAYEAGLLLALRAVPRLRGVSIGLDTLLDLRLVPPARSAAGPVADGGISGQAATATSA